MFTLISVCVAVSLLSGLSGQQILNGSCTSFGVSPVQNFYPGFEITGEWFLYATFDAGLAWHNYDCISFISVDPDIIDLVDPALPGTVYTIESGKSQATGLYEYKDSEMYFSNPRVGFYDYIQGSDSTPTQIIYTDLLTYIEFTCADEGANQSNCYVGIFTRDAVPQQSHVNTINQFLDDHSIDRSSLRYVNHAVLYCAL